LQKEAENLVREIAEKDHALSLMKKAIYMRTEMMESEAKNLSESLNHILLLNGQR
jgi:hypothetical protein